MPVFLGNLPQNVIVTFIIPTFNRAEKLKRVLEQVIQEKHKYYPQLEIIVMDGGSSDGTVNIIRSFAKDIAYWQSQPDKGLYDAFNQGLKHATGSIIRFVADDDVFLNGHTATFVAYLQAHPDTIAVAGSDEQYMRTSQGICFSGQTSFTGRLTMNRFAFMTNVWVTNECLFIRREFFDIEGGYDTSYPISADTDLKFRLLATEKPVIILPITILHKIYDQESLSIKTRNQCAKDVLQILCKYGYWYYIPIFILNIGFAIIFPEPKAKMLRRTIRLLMERADYYLTVLTNGKRLRYTMPK